MNGYDFDNTILHGNSWRRFYFYCLARFPYIALLLVVQLIPALFYVLHIIDNRKFSAFMSIYLLFIPNKRRVVEKFWDKNQKHIKQWYLDARKEDDFVISASPRFLVEPMCNRLGIKCIASEVSIKNGQYVGPYYYGPMKIYGYVKEFGNKPLKTYYSDSFSDTPMWLLAQEGWYVQGDQLTLCYQNGAPVDVNKKHRHKKYWRL